MKTRLKSTKKINNKNRKEQGHIRARGHAKEEKKTS
jgi:hypothetical protein